MLLRLVIFGSITLVLAIGIGYSYCRDEKKNTVESPVIQGGDYCIPDHIQFFPIAEANRLALETAALKKARDESEKMRR